MKWIAGYTKVLVVSTTRVDYCPKGDPVLSAQNNKINQSPVVVHWLSCGVHLYVFLCREKNEVLLIFNIFIFIYLSIAFFFSTLLSANTQTKANYQE